MNGETLRDTAREHPEGLPAVALEHPFGPDWEVFKVQNKVFMLMTDIPGQPVVIVKADASDAAALREAHADITPRYHMNKKHWITPAAGDSIDKHLVEELLTDSYRLVVGRQSPVGLRSPRSSRTAHRARGKMSGMRTAPAGAKEPTN